MAITRFAELRRVLEGGQSELLIAIVRLAILYEDLRLEIGEFRILHDRVIEQGAPEMEYRTLYFLRRSLITIGEFRSALTMLRKTEDYKAAELTISTRDATHIREADAFLQRHGGQLKQFRNEFAAHIQAATVQATLQQFSNEVGKLTWNPGRDPWTIGVECDFAGVVLAGMISSKLKNGNDLLTELRTALELHSKSFMHAQLATTALVSAFLWDRFGT